ncbi:MAG: hypothetical protein M1830_002947 [Pleopsidium flavum]|nr:MAG: hypothetical protein M1830_002947 [Pleopsidium flavum]
MSYPNPSRRASPTQDSIPTFRSAEEKEVPSARGRGNKGDDMINGTRDPRGSRDWKISKDDDQYHSDKTKRKTRSIDEDWFEEQLAQKARHNSSKVPSRKAGWNQWISPDLQSTTQNSGNRRANDPVAGRQSHSDITTSDYSNGIGRGSPPMHPDRRNFAGAHSPNESIRINFEKHANLNPWPPTLLREEDTAMTDSSDARRRSDSCRGSEVSGEKEDLRSLQPRDVSPSTDPRRLGRTPTRAPSVSASGHGSPHSAIGLNSGKHAMKDHGSNSGQHTGGQTPKISTYAPTPKMSAPPLPPLPPPPPPPPSSTVVAPEALAQMSRLLAVLGEFTDHVSDMASVTVQRDNAKKQLAKKAAEYNKWRKQHASFPPLAEQQEKERASAQNEFEELDRKLKQHVKSRDKLAQAIAMSVVSNRSNDDGGGGNERVQHLERELEAVRSEIQGMRTKLHQASAEYGQIHSIQSKHTSIQNQLVDLNKKLERVAAGSNPRPVSSFASDNTIINIDKQVSKLQEKLVKVQERVDDIPNLKLDVSKSKQETRDLSSVVNTQVDSLQELKGTVIGEKDDKGLIDIIATVEEDVDKLRGALTTSNEDLDTFQSELHKSNGRIATLERASSRRQTPQPGIATTKFDDTELRSALAIVKEEVTALQCDVTALRHEQEEKDGLVGDEIDTINKSTSRLDNSVRTNRNDFEAAISRINASISSLQARPSPPPAISNSPIPQPLMNGAWKPDDAVGKKIQETLKQHRQALERHRETISMLERAWQNLDGRFNSLTTDTLAQNMVHQMSEMYPYAANVQVEIDLAKQRDDHLRQRIQEIAGKVDKASLAVSDVPVSENPKEQSGISREQVFGFQKQIDTISEDIKTIRKNANSHSTAVANRVDTVDATVRTQMPLLNEGFEPLKKDVNALSSRVDDIHTTMATELGILTVQVEKLNEHCGIADAEDAIPSSLPEQAPVTNTGVTNPTAPAAVASSAAPDVEVIDDEDVLPTGMRRKYLLKKKKRKRAEESESEYDDRAERRAARSAD